MRGKLLEASTDMHRILAMRLPHAIQGYCSPDMCGYAPPLTLELTPVQAGPVAELLTRLYSGPETGHGVTAGNLETWLDDLRDLVGDVVCAKAQSPQLPLTWRKRVRAARTRGRIFHAYRQSLAWPAGRAIFCPEWML